MKIKEVDPYGSEQTLFHFPMCAAGDTLAEVIECLTLTICELQDLADQGYVVAGGTDDSVYLIKRGK